MSDIIYILLVALPLALLGFVSAFWGGVYKCLCFSERLKLGGAFAFSLLLLFWLGTLAGNSFANSIGWLAIPFAETILLLTGVKVIYGAIMARPEQKAYDLANNKDLIAVSFAIGLNAFLIGLGYGLLRPLSSVMLMAITLLTAGLSILGAYMGTKVGKLFYTTFVGIIAGVLVITLAAVLAIDLFEILKDSSST